MEAKKVNLNVLLSKNFRNWGLVTFYSLNGNISITRDETILTKLLTDQIKNIHNGR